MYSQCFTLCYLIQQCSLAKANWRAKRAKRTKFHLRAMFHRYKEKVKTNHHQLSTPTKKTQCLNKHAWYTRVTHLLVSSAYVPSSKIPRISCSAVNSSTPPTARSVHVFGEKQCVIKALCIPWISFKQTETLKC
jgi:hypothetical protein